MLQWAEASDDLMTGTHLTSVIPGEFTGMRVDQAASRLFTDFSRTTLKGWILDGKLLVNHRRVKPREILRGGEAVDLWPSAEPRVESQPQPIALTVIHEDDDLIVIDKPAGLVVHPGAGNRAGTLLNALLHFDPGLALLPRAGIVHRLDKETSGLLVIARSPRAHTYLVKELKARRIAREYDAVVRGVLIAGGSVSAPLGRHPVQRTRMAVVAGGREAVTHYRVVRRFRAHTHLRLRLETGRTHQLRVHMAHLRMPIVGDPVYGGRLLLPPGATPVLARTLQGFKRQALHASRLRLLHPATGHELEWQSPLPPDMTLLLEVLSEDARGLHSGARPP
ncbi:MAG: 23S rRNA pseudouridine(1911/1915/1917) synthase RluD [Gammaproteobacteria bacterium]